MNGIYFENNLVFPSKVVCIGRNYVEHIKELNNEIPKKIVIFNKPNSAICDQFYYIKNGRFEGEISFLIKNNTICGVGFGFDLTKVDEQEVAKNKGLPWERAKAFDNSAVFSKFVKISDKDIDNLQMKLYKNGKLTQFADISLMINKPKDILSEINSFLTLNDFDIVMSGTPKGVGSFEIGDRFKADILLDDKVIIKADYVVNNS